MNGKSGRPCRPRTEDRKGHQAQRRQQHDKLARSRLRDVGKQRPAIPQHDERRHHDRAHGVAQPPREPDRAGVGASAQAGDRHGRRANRGGNRRGAGGNDDEAQDVGASSRMRTARARSEWSARRRRRASSVLPTAITSDAGIDPVVRQVDDEGAKGNGGPGAQAEQEQRRDGQTRRRPHRAGVLVREGEQETERPAAM